MYLKLATRNIAAALVLVPSIALAGIATEPFFGKSGAEAQQRTRSANQIDRAPNRSEDDTPELVPLDPCEPGTKGAPAELNCRPWTPPTHAASSKEDCSCELTYKMVNGQKVAVRDCYVLLPTNEVYYCPNPRVVR